MTTIRDLQNQLLALTEKTYTGRCEQHPDKTVYKGCLKEGYSFTTEELLTADQLLPELQNGRFFAGKREEYEDWVNVGDVTQDEADKFEAELQRVEEAVNRGTLKVSNVVRKVHDFVDGVFYYTNKFDYELTL